MKELKDNNAVDFSDLLLLPLEIFKNFPEFFRIYLEFSEGINRSGNFTLALNRNLKKGLPPEIALRKAAFETRENPIDYRRMGAKIFALNEEAFNLLKKHKNESQTHEDLAKFGNGIRTELLGF